ncbi:hypothetical protein [Luedemannella helvata]|uniref:Uncharacterized protein n=1 Tax=Luedemannella helvata TaxID=349315 RepID=A0ABP4XAE7_9ACTN
MSTDDQIARARAELPEPPNPARAIPLARLGQMLMERYTRVGAGAASAEPDLDAAIAAFDESYSYLQFGSPARAKVAALLGNLLAIRHTVHLGPARDRDTGIHMLEEAVGSPVVPPLISAWARLQLGQLYLSRVIEQLRSPDFVREAIYGAGVPTTVDDTDRAIELFHSAAQARTGSSDLVRAAEAFIEMAEVLRDLFRGLNARPMSFDAGGLIRTMEKIQTLSARFQSGGRGLGMTGPMVPLRMEFFDSDGVSVIDPLDRPVAVVEDPGPQAPPPPTRPPVVAKKTDYDDTRAALHALVLTTVGDPDLDVWRAAIELLRPTTPAPSGETVDDLVAMASILADADADGVTAAIDDLLYASALLLRHRRDHADDGIDLAVGTQRLWRAAHSIPDDHAAVVPIIGALGAFVDGGKPPGQPLATVAAPFADRIDTLMANGVVQDAADLVTLHALRCLCRAAGDAATGDDRITLRQAVGAVPLDYPWLAALRTAAEA